MNYPIFPLLIENHTHCFSCYNGWKISPESLEDFIGISTDRAQGQSRPDVGLSALAEEDQGQGAENPRGRGQKDRPDAFERALSNGLAGQNSLTDIINYCSRFQISAVGTFMDVDEMKKAQE